MRELDKVRAAVSAVDAEITVNTDHEKGVHGYQMTLGFVDVHFRRYHRHLRVTVNVMGRAVQLANMELFGTFFPASLDNSAIALKLVAVMQRPQDLAAKVLTHFETNIAMKEADVKALKSSLAAAKKAFKALEEKPRG